MLKEFKFNSFINKNNLLMILEGNKTMFKVEIEGSDLILNNAPTKMNLMLVGDTGIGKITKIE